MDPKFTHVSVDDEDEKSLLLKAENIDPEERKTW